MHFHITNLALLASSFVVLAAPLPLPDFIDGSDLLLVSSHHFHVRSLPSVVSWLCDLARLDKVCQKTSGLVQKITGYGSSSGNTVTMPLGKATGLQLANKVARYTVPYVKAPVGNLRFKPTVPQTSWSGVLNATTLPPACLQSTLMSTSASETEDCLYMNIHVPSSATSYSNLPIFVWLHGGSFVSGSSTDQALDGSLLAAGGNMIVITVQYRLGMLGFLNAPSAGVNGNMGVWDVLEALSFIKNNIASFGGNPNAVTLAGQSSGASLIKTLFTIPRADNSFNRAILQSAPLDYGDHSPSTSTAVGSLFLSQSEITSCTDIICLQALSVDDILSAQDEVFKISPSAIGPQISASEPIRPFVDGSIVPQPFLTSLNNGGFGNKNRQIIFTTVKNEAGPTIASISSDSPIPPSYYGSYIQALMDPERASQVIDSGLYELDPNSTDATREALELLGTDWIWRCPNQQAAVNATRSGNGAKGVWLAEFDLGIPYTTNLGLKFCKGRVCHQDDIEAVFSTGGTSLTTSQVALEAEVLSRWSSFSWTGNPNPSNSNYLSWNPISTSDGNGVGLNMLVLNGTSSEVVQEQRREQCGPDGFWGNVARFDSQIYSA